MGQHDLPISLKVWSSGSEWGCWCSCRYRMFYGSLFLCATRPQDLHGLAQQQCLVITLWLWLMPSPFTLLSGCFGVVMGEFVSVMWPSTPAPIPSGFLIHQLMPHRTCWKHLQGWTRCSLWSPSVSGRAGAHLPQQTRVVRKCQRLGGPAEDLRQLGSSAAAPQLRFTVP